MEELTPEQQAQMRQQCIFCQIADGKVAAKKVYEDDKVLAVLDINPANPGHILLLPKEHIAIMPQMDDELIGYMGIVSKQLSQVLLRTLQAQGTTIFVANGVAAGQRAPHFMIHIIPRMEGDDAGLKPLEKKYSEEQILQIHQGVYEAIKRVLGDAIPPEKQPINLDQKETPKEEKPGTKEPGKKETPKESKKKASPLDDVSKFLTGQ